MTLEQLIVLNAIIEQRTFRGAAETLNKAQSAVSHMMKKLENEIGYDLLSREKYRPVLTAKGEIFYRHSLRMLQQFQELKSISMTLGTEQEAEISMTVAATFPFGPTLSLIGDMTSRYPTTHIKMSRDNMGGSLEKLLRGEVQIAISTLDEVPLDQIEAVPLTPVIISPVAHPDFQAASDNKLKSNAEMHAFVQIVVADSGQANHQSRGLLPGGLRWTVSDFATKKEILLAKMGWGGMPEHMVQAELDKGELVRLNIEGYPPARVEHFAMRRRDTANGVVAQAIWNNLRGPSKFE